MKIMPKVSIIIPAYNSEATIARCLESILQQTYKDYECIVVNDGSNDNTSKICHQYSASDERVKVIDKNNGGVSSARNTGLDSAIGDWITFVDSDDYIDSSYLEDFASQLNDVDIVFSSSYTIENGNTIKVKSNQIDYHGKFEYGARTLNELYFNGYTNMPWGKFFKADIIRSNNLYFDTRYQYGEDILFTLSFLEFTQNVSVAPIQGYHYMIYPNSLSRKKYNINTILEWNDLLIEKYESIRSKLIDPIYITEIISNNYTYYTFYVQHNILESCLENNKKIEALEQIYKRHRNKIKIIKLRNSGIRNLINYYLYNINCPKLTLALGRFLRL